MSLTCINNKHEILKMNAHLLTNNLNNQQYYCLQEYI